VVALARYANDPDAFWKEWIKVQVAMEKKIVEQASTEESADVGLADVEKMLSEVESRRKVEPDLLT